MTCRTARDGTIDRTETSYRVGHRPGAMATRQVLALTLLAFAALAGCSDGPASGDIEAIPGPVSVDGTTNNQYTAANYPYQPNPVNQEQICPPETAPEAVEKCTHPSTTFDIHFMSLPEPDGNGYAIYMMGGTVGERQLAILADKGNGMWGVNLTEEGDLSTQFERMELRMGSFVLASAPAAAGSQAFQPNPGLSAVTVTASYKGATLTLDVANLPGEGPFVGRLYTPAIDGGNITLAESFPIVAGAQEFEAQQADIGDYAEFHIHVGNSKIYLYQGTIA